jgi:hypothetical protein
MTELRNCTILCTILFYGDPDVFGMKRCPFPTSLEHDPCFTDETRRWLFVPKSESTFLLPLLFTLLKVIMALVEA